MPEIQRAICYVRQSLTADDSQSLSLDFQERALREHCARNGWAILEPVIRDPDEKGNDPERPGLRELLARVERQRPQIVAVYAMSRFARDLVLQELTFARIASHGARLVSVTEPHAEDELVRQILGAVSQAERRRMGRMLSSAWRERAQRGLHHGYAPFGYRPSENGKLEPDPDQARWVATMADQIERGWSLSRVARWLATEGVNGRVWEPVAIRRILSNPVIAGAVRTGNVLTWNAHEPILDRSRWETLQGFLDRRRIVRTKAHASWLEGLMVCGCGAPMYLMRYKRKDGSPVAQFRCSARNRESIRPQHPRCTATTPRSITGPRAERATLAALKDDLSQLAGWPAVLAAAEAEHKAAHPNVQKQRARLERERQKVVIQRDRVLDRYAAGKLDAERWEAQDEAYTARLSAIARQIEELPLAPDPNALRATETLLVGVRGALDELAAHEPDAIGAFLRRVDAKVTVTRSGTRILWPEPIAGFFSDERSAAV